jgi:hypothetical protein
MHSFMRHAGADSSAYVMLYCPVIRSDGVWGLLGRGLGTKILSNGFSAMLFSVLWRYFEQKLRERGKKNDKGN